MVNINKHFDSLLPNNCYQQAISKLINNYTENHGVIVQYVIVYITGSFAVGSKLVIK